MLIAVCKYLLLDRLLIPTSCALLDVQYCRLAGALLGIQLQHEIIQVLSVDSTVTVSRPITVSDM